MALKKVEVTRVLERNLSFQEKKNLPDSAEKGKILRITG